jgi:hypothetical protein
MSHRKNLIVGLGVVLLTVLGSVSIAEAQGYPPPYYPPPPPPPPPHGVYRGGLVYGFSGGVGAIHINNCLPDVCGVAGLLEGHIGGMINPRTALLLEIWGADHPWSSGGSSFETINSFFTGAVQYWVNDIIWIKGGLGVAELRQTLSGYNYYYNYGYATTADITGFGLFGAAGVEVLQSYNFALDIQLRLANGFYSQGGDSFSAQNFALMVGFNWY